VGDSFAAARQRAVAALATPEEAAMLERPNNILGVEYCKALLRRQSGIIPVTIPRKGADHNGELREGEHPSASAIRGLLESGAREQALEWMAPAMREAYLEEESCGRAPVFYQTCERAILARLRSMTRGDFAALDEGKEGLYNRLYDASRTAVSVKELLDAAKTKRYSHARLRRMILWAYLGMHPQELPKEIPYLRPLAANERGRVLLGRMRKRANIPVVMKNRQILSLGEEAQALFALESRAADLYALAYPDLSAAKGGSVGREGTVLL
jgi:predicted nucleotidyltransferase